MARPKGSKNKDSIKTEDLSDENQEIQQKDVEEDLEEIRRKRDKLIEEIRPNLLSNSDLRRGGAGVLQRNIQEQSYIPVFNEINELGKKLGLSPIGLGHLRRN